MHQHEKKLASRRLTDRARVAPALLATLSAATSHIPMRAARRVALDSAWNGAQTRRTARNWACDAPQQLTLSNGHRQRWVCGTHTLTNDRLGDASRSADEVGFGEHDCEHIAGRNGYERDQQPRQVGGGEGEVPLNPFEGALIKDPQGGGATYFQDRRKRFART